MIAGIHLVKDSALENQDWSLVQVSATLGGRAKFDEKIGTD
jgi:hypothetical protein